MSAPAAVLLSPCGASLMRRVKQQRGYPLRCSLTNFVNFRGNVCSSNSFALARTAVVHNSRRFFAMQPTLSCLASSSSQKGSFVENGPSPRTKKGAKVTAQAKGKQQPRAKEARGSFNAASASTRPVPQSAEHVEQLQKKRELGAPAPVGNLSTSASRGEDASHKIALLPDGSISTGQSLRTLKKKEIEQIADVELLERVSSAMAVPDVNTYDLHLYDTITEDIVRSVEARKIMFRFTAAEQQTIFTQAFNAVEEKSKGRIIGSALYFRVVHPLDVVRAAECGTSTHGISSSSPPPPPLSTEQARYAQEVKAVRDAVERILRRYVSRLIEPFPNELAIDVTHYATFLPLLNAARRNVEQALKDMKDFLEWKAVNPEGIPGGPPPAEETAPLSADVMAAEIARCIRREVLTPQTDESKARVSSSPHGIRICIGVASSPALAKIACDAEVASVVHKLRKAARRKTGRRDTANAGGGGSIRDYGYNAGDSDVPLVSVRSLYRHTKTVESSKQLMAALPVRHVPTLTPAFVELLRRVFDIHKCGDILQHIKMMFFCFSLNTFRACYDAATSSMTFPIEANIQLFSVENLFGSCCSLRPLSSNAISLVNPTRTEFVLNFGTFTRDSFQTTMSRCFFSLCTYGRVNSDEEVVQRFLDVVKSSYYRLHRRGVSFSSIMVFMDEDRVMQHQFQIHLEHFLSVEELLARVKTQLGPLLKTRKGKGCDLHGGLNSATLSFQHMRPIPMVPPAMLREAAELRETVLAAKTRFQHSKRVTEQRKRIGKLVEASTALPPPSSPTKPKKKPATAKNAKVGEIFYV